MPQLLIGTHFKRPKAPISFPNGAGKPDTTYYFKPRDPNDENSEHVCLVENAAHIQRLLSISEGYYIAEDQAADDSVARPAAAPVAAPKVTGGTEAQALADVPHGTSTASGDAEVEVDTEAVGKLLALPLKEFKEAIKTAPSPLLREALATEKAKGEDERPTYVKALDGQLNKAG